MWWWFSHSVLSTSCDAMDCSLAGSPVHGMANVLSGFPGSSDGKESSCNAGDPNLIPGSGRSPGEGTGNPLQYSCLLNSMDRKAWQATVHGATKSRIWLSDQKFHLQMSYLEWKWYVFFSNRNSPNTSLKHLKSIASTQNSYERTQVHYIKTILLQVHEN